MYPKIGICPVIDGRQFGVREDLEQQTMHMANAAKDLIESNLRYPDGTKVECVIAPHYNWRRRRSIRMRNILSDAECLRYPVCDTVLVLRQRNHGSQSADHKGSLGIQRYRAPRRCLSGRLHGSSCTAWFAGIFDLRP